MPALPSTVSYESSDILKASATFSYDRYICGRASSYSSYRGNANNLKESSDRSGRGFEPRDSSRPNPTEALFEEDRKRYGNTVPEGSFGITQGSAKRKVEAQIHKDNAMYGNTWPAWNSKANDKKNNKATQAGISGGLSMF